MRLYSRESFCPSTGWKLMSRIEPWTLVEIIFLNCASQLDFFTIQPQQQERWNWTSRSGYEDTLVNLPASQHWRLCRLTKTLGRWWWTWHLQQQGCVLWLAGLPGVELSQHVYGWTACPESGAGSSTCLGRSVSPVWNKDHIHFKGIVQLKKINESELYIYSPSIKVNTNNFILKNVGNR